MSTKPEILSVRVSGDLLAALKALADEQGVSVSDVLRRAAEDAVRAARPPVCTGLCTQPQTISGWGRWSPRGIAGEVKVYCGCGTVVSSTLMFEAS